jgi:hypothetical protein
MVAIPADAEVIGEGCFAGIHSIVEVDFRRASKIGCIEPQSFAFCSRLERIEFPTSMSLDRIECEAFARCRKLQSLAIPSSVEHIGRDCFSDCLVTVLSKLAFPAPSHLKELLSLPPNCAGLVDIPDSVEIIEFSFQGGPHVPHALNFGCESKLNEVRTIWISSPGARRSLLRVSNRTLRIFRLRLEFEPYDRGRSVDESG